MKELRSLPHRVSLGLSGGGGEGGGGGPRFVGFFGYPPSGAGQNPVAKGARFRSFWVSGFLDVQRKNRPPLMLLMLAWACRLMLLMLVVSWPRCLGVSAVMLLMLVVVYVWRKVSMLGQNLLDLSQSLSGKVFTCWNKTPLIDMLCWIKTAPARVVLCNFRSTTMQACSCSFVTMAASVRHNLKLGISEFRCVAALPLLELSS